MKSAVIALCSICFAAVAGGATVEILTEGWTGSGNSNGWKFANLGSDGAMSAGSYIESPKWMNADILSAMVNVRCSTNQPDRTPKITFCYDDAPTARAIHKAHRRRQLPQRLAVTAGAVAVFAILVAAMLKVFNADRQAERQSTYERIGLSAYAATNFVKAAHFLQRAADTGSTNGLVYYELAEIHARGRGVRQDRIQAISYAQRAVDFGCTNALPMLRRLKKIQRATAR